MFKSRSSFIKKGIGALLAGGMGLTLLPSTSEAGNEITRSCDGFYAVKIKKINGVATSGGTTFGSFSATRHCGASVPGRCRERARETIFTCGTVHYAQRWTRNTIPSHCTIVEGVKHYDIKDIKDSLEKSVCCGASNKSRKSAEVELHVNSSGGEGCGPGNRTPGVFDPSALSGSKRLEDSYLIDCKDARKRLCS